MENREKYRTRTRTHRASTGRDDYKLLVVARYLGELCLGASVISIYKNGILVEVDDPIVKEIVRDCIDFHKDKKKSEIFKKLIRL